MNCYLFLLEMHDHKFANKLIQCILVSIQANIYRIRNGLFFFYYTILSVYLPRFVLLKVKIND